MSPTEQLRYRNMEDFGYGPNVMKKTKVCPKCGKATREAFKVENGAKVRVCKKCGETI